MNSQNLILRERTHALMQSVKNMNTRERQLFFGTKVKKVIDKELDIIEQGIESYNVKYKFWDLVEKQSGLVLGNAGFHVWHFRHNCAEIGYCLHDDTFKQKGYMTKALTAILPYAFSPEMNLNRITARTASHNAASIALLKKFGFKHEGKMREDYLLNGTYMDSEIFGLIKREFNLAETSI